MARQGPWAIIVINLSDLTYQIIVSSFPAEENECMIGFNLKEGLPQFGAHRDTVWQEQRYAYTHTQIRLD